MAFVNPAEALEEKWKETFGVFRAGWISGVCFGAFSIFSFILLKSNNTVWGLILGALAITHLYRGVVRGR